MSGWRKENLGSVALLHPSVGDSISYIPLCSFVWMLNFCPFFFPPRQVIGLQQDALLSC